MFAELERGFELAVFLRDRLRLDDPLQHQFAFALQLRILVRSIPIIAGAGEDTVTARSPDVTGAVASSATPLTEA